MIRKICTIMPFIGALINIPGIILNNKLSIASFIFCTVCGISIIIMYAKTDNY